MIFHRNLNEFVCIFDISPLKFSLCLIILSDLLLQFLGGFNLANFKVPVGLYILGCLYLRRFTLVSARQGWPTIRPLANARSWPTIGRGVSSPGMRGNRIHRRVINGAMIFDSKIEFRMGIAIAGAVAAELGGYRG